MYRIKCVFFLVSSLIVASLVWANHSTLRNDSFDLVPDSNTRDFRTNSRIMWDHEHAQREGRQRDPFIFSGGIHGTSSTLTSPAFATEAFVPERINQVATAISYDAIANDVCWTIISSDNNGITGWTRVGTTAYYYQCEGDTTPNEPTLPLNSTWLMRVLVTDSALTTIVDLTVPRPGGELIGNTFTSYVNSGCIPAVPSSSLTFAAFACTAIVTTSTTPPRLVSIAQSTAAVSLTSVNGVHWLAVCRDTVAPINGWTRQSGTHYVHQQSASEPATPAGCLIIAQATVGASIISAVSEWAPRYLTENITVSVNRTIGQPAMWTIAPHVILTVATGVTITHNGEIIAPCRNSKAWITLQGTGVINLVGAKEVCPQWWGAAVGDGVNDSVAMQAAFDSPAVGGTVILPPGTYNTSTTVVIKKRLTILGPGTTIVAATGTSALQLGDDATPAHNSYLILGLITGTSGTYTNSGIIFRHSSLSTVFFEDIRFFEQGIDFNPFSTLLAGINAVGENRIYGGTIQRIANGVRFRYTGTGTEFVNPTARGWAEGNTLDISVFGCDRGILQEANAFATYTNLRGVLDCAQDKTGVASTTSLDIEANIEYGIVGNLYFHRVPARYTLSNAISHKLSALPLDPNYAHDTPNLLYNADFRVPRAVVANPFVNVGQNNLTVTVNADASIRMIPTGGDPYIQIGVSQFTFHAGTRYITGRVRVRQQGAGDPLVRLDLLVTDGGTVVLPSRNVAITAVIGDYSEVLYTWLLTASTTAVQSLRVRHPDTVSTLDVADVRLWQGFGRMPPQRPFVHGAFTGWAYAAPTTGTWAVGERVFNLVPVVGSPKSWVCTVAGTPGTWVSEGNL